VPAWSTTLIDAAALFDLQCGQRIQTIGPIGHACMAFPCSGVRRRPDASITAANDGTAPVDGTDHEIRANFDREAGATCGGWARFRMPGAYNQTARHAGECAE